MHILHVIDSLGLGGAERMLIDLANQTMRDGHQVAVCVTRNRAPLLDDLDDAIEVLVLGRKRRITPVAALRFATWIARHDFDVVHVHMRSSVQFVLPMKIAGMIRVPLVFHDHYGTIELDRAIPVWFRIAHHWIDRYVGVYEQLAAWARAAGMPATKVVTIPNAIDLDRLTGVTPAPLREELHVDADKAIVLVVATLRPDKAIDVLVEAISRTTRRGDYVVAIAGGEGDPGYADACRKRLRELGLEQDVRLLGPRTDVPRLLAAADAAIMPSRTESGPLVLIEQLAAGLPVVATRVGDIGRRLADAGVPGFVSAEDPTALAAALDALLALSPTERYERGLVGRRALSAGFELRTAMPRWYALYDEVAARRRSSVATVRR